MAQTIFSTSSSIWNVAEFPMLALIFTKIATMIIGSSSGG
jgi:hypothetical protein